MNLTFGQVIPAGYALDIHTWENDADNYKTQTFMGLTKETVNQFLKVLPIFGSVGRRGCEQLGNEDFRDYDTILTLSEKVWNGEITSEFIQTYFKFTPPVNEEVFDDEVDDIISNVSQRSAILDALQDILGTPVEYDYEFIRVFSNYEVRYFEKELKMPESPVINSGAFNWQHPNTKFEIE